MGLRVLWKADRACINAHFLKFRNLGATNKSFSNLCELLNKRKLPDILRLIIAVEAVSSICCFFTFKTSSRIKYINQYFTEFIYFIYTLPVFLLQTQSSFYCPPFLTCTSFILTTRPWDKLGWECMIVSYELPWQRRDFKLRSSRSQSDTQTTSPHWLLLSMLTPAKAHNIPLCSSQ